MGNVTKPDWPYGIGRDRYGLWVSFLISDVVLRMRWIPPGQFVMGSPETEAGRYDVEKRHQVTITKGFWLFDTPVPQSLWKAVMDENPSRFQSSERPVEQVSWDGCGRFF